MRKRAVALLAAATLLCTAVTMAAGSTAGDPLVSKSYIDGTYVPGMVSKAEARADEGQKGVYDAAAARLKSRHEAFAAKAGVLSGDSFYHPAFADIRVKRGDAIQVSTGSGFLLLAGEATLSCPAGKVLDLSNGWEKSTGALTAGRRYLAVEDTVATVTVTSPTAVLSLEGFYGLTASAETDYNALAAALKTMGLFKGSDTGYGSGYDLEAAPTRIQGLIMFLRLIGEEDAALATTAVCPFTDVPDWCKAYVAYAYEKGYTKGVDSEAKRFDPNSAVTAGEYMTFLLRALGYRDSGENADFAWNTSLQRALDLGVLTAKEHKLLVEEPFLRAQVAYLSYFSLDTAYRDGSGSLMAHLTTGGTLDPEVVKTVREAVTVKRLR